jgi:hypothetical protein
VFTSCLRAFVTFYEARPVKRKIRLIASSFYPSFHVLPNRLLFHGLIQLMRRRPSLVASFIRRRRVYAHYTNRAVAQTIITNFKLQNQPSSRCFPGGRKNFFLSPSRCNIQRVFVPITPCSAVSQHRPAANEQFPRNSRYRYLLAGITAAQNPLICPTHPLIVP